MILSKKTYTKRPNVLLIAEIANRSKQSTPFNSDIVNDAYANLCSLCSEAGMDLYITHYDNVLPNSFVFSWIHKDGSWEATELHISQLSLSYAELPSNESRANLIRNILNQHDIMIINDLQLSDCILDKLSTYKMFPEFSPPMVDTADPNVAARVRELSTHSDLSIEKLFLKPRFGARGEGIDVIDFSDLTSDYVLEKRHYSVQVFLETDAGIPELNIQGRHDLRMVIYNGEVIQLFVKTPVRNPYISNCALGGKIIHYDTNLLPEKCRELALSIDERINHYTPRLYSVDVGIGRSGRVWLYELNTLPGIVWEEENMADKPKYVYVHKKIAEMLKSCLE